MRTAARATLGIGLTLATLGAGYLWLRPAAVVVELAEVTGGPLLVTVDEDGKTRVKERYVVSAPLAGRLARIEIHAGDEVRRGETVLATIHPPDPSLLDARTVAEATARSRAAEAAVEQANARGAEARERRALAEDRFQRAQRLVGSNSISRGEYDEAEHGVLMAAEQERAAQFGLRVAQFELDVARAALSRTQPVEAEGKSASEPFEIRSPVDGRVLRVLHEDAAHVTAGQPLLEVGNLQELEVELDVLSADAARIRPGASVRLEHWGGDHPLAGRVRLVEPAGFTKVSALGVEEQRVLVLVDFAPDTPRPLELGTGFRVEASIVVWSESDVTQIPVGSLVRQGETWGVFVERQGRAEWRAVEIGQRNGVAAQIVTGVERGERVVVFPSDQVRPGARIRAAAR